MQPIIKYYYKPPTKYPARIYALWGNEWQPRNMLPMGIANRSSLTRRDMTKYEQERAQSSKRMIYYQFESLDDLLGYEREELADDGRTQEEIEVWVKELTEKFKKYFPT